MSELPQDNITHEGIISQKSENSYTVLIVSKASCASCQVAGACSASDIEEKNVNIQRKVTDNYQPGDKVTIMMDQSLGIWAVLFGYVFPFLVLLIGLILFTQIISNEGIAGLLALSLLIPYYFILYLLRGYMSKKFQFRIIS